MARIGYIMCTSRCQGKSNIFLGMLRTVDYYQHGVVESLVSRQGSRMKPIHLIHAAVTFLLFLMLLAVGALMAFGVLQFRGAAKEVRPIGGQQALEGDKVKARLVVIRGAKPNSEYPIYEGKNVLGRADQKPVDIDLFAQEAPDRVWATRQHAIIVWENGGLSIEDLNSTNGTFVNRDRIQPGEKKALKADHVIQIGEVHLKVAL